MQKLVQKLLVIVAMGLVSFQVAHGYTPTDTALLKPRPFQDWKTLETPHFRINYQNDHSHFAQRLARVAEKVYAKQLPRFQWQPKRQIEVVILDSYDGSNGGATVMPYNQFFIFMNAPVEDELLDNSPWIEQVFTHELVHVLHLDQAAGGAQKLRNIFGRFFFTFPQIFSPSWVSEGIAVYEETDEDRQFGRGQSAFYDAMMRTEYMNGLRSYSELNYHGYIGTDWPSGQSYLYGYYFFEFLSVRYSEQQAFDYLFNWNNNIIPWRMEARARETFGVSAETLWKQFQGYIAEKYKHDPLVTLDVAQQPIVEGGRVNSNPVWVADDEFYFYENNGSDHPSLQKLEAGKPHKVAHVPEYRQIDIHPQSGVLLSRDSICNNVEVYADLYRLQDNGDWRRITKCGRFPRMAWSSAGDRIAAVHVEKGTNQILLLDAEGQTIVTTPALSQGEVVGQLDWSPDDTQLVASVRREQSGWNLELLDLNTLKWQVISNNDQLEQMPRFSADGKSIYFISDQGGVINVRRLDLADGLVHTVTQTQTAITDYDIYEDRIRVAQYDANGISIQQQTLSTYGEPYPAIVEDREPLQSLVNQPEFDLVQYDNISDYSPLKTVAPTSWFALLYADSEDNSWIQGILNGQDVLGFHTWQLAPAYYIDKNSVGGSMGYLAYHRLAFLVDRELETVRAGNDFVPSTWNQETRFQAIWTQPFNRFEGTFTANFGIAKEVVKQVDEDLGVLYKQEDNLGGVSLNWSDYDQYLNSISVEDGRSVQVQLERYDFFGDGFFDGNVMTLDWREYIGLFSNHVLALRMVLGEADTGAKPFELGNELDQLQSLGAMIGFGRTGYTLRGYADNNPELQGEDLRLYSAEYRLPLGQWYDGFSRFPLGLGKAAVHLFVDHGAAWSAGQEKDYYTGVGIELRPDLLVGYSTFTLQSTLGIAQGLDDQLGETTIYLRLGASF